MFKNKPLNCLGYILPCVLFANNSFVFAEVKKHAQLEEVIVTAQKREQNLQDVPMAVTAMTRTFLEDNGITNVSDLAKMVPSLQLSEKAEPSQVTIQVRGVGTLVPGMSLESNVSVVVDNVPLARNEMASFEFADLERIEVLRGPQGTLFGKNATAGLVHVISRDPAPEFEAFVKANVEQRESWAGGMASSAFGVSGPLTETLGGRLTGYVKRTEGFYIDVLNDNATGPNSDFGGARGKLMWTPSDDLVVKLNMESTRSDGATAPVTFRYANPDKEAESPNIQYGPENRTTKTYGLDSAINRNDGFSLSVDWTVGPFVVTSVTGWRDYLSRTVITLPNLEGDSIDIKELHEHRDITTFTQELRLSSAEPGALDWTIGALWFDSRVDNLIFGDMDNVPAGPLALVGSPIDPLIPILLSNPTTAGNVDIDSYKFSGADTKNLGVFAQGTWHISDLWHLTAGGRYIAEQQDAQFYNRDLMRATGTTGPDIETITGPFDGGIEDEAFSGTLSLQYDGVEDTTLYGTVSTGYRGGAINVEAATADIEDAYANPVKPETALSFELGSKSRLFDNRMQLNIALFRTVFTDFQAYLAVPPDPDDIGGVIRFDVKNAGELATQGVEIEVQGQPSESLFVAGSILYNEAVFDDFRPKCFPGQRVGEAGGEDDDGDGSCDTQDVSGKTLPNAPKVSLSLSARYQVPLDDGDSAFAQLTGRWQDDVQFNATQDPLTIQEAYGVVDMRVGWVGLDEKLELTAYVKNLFDQFSVNSMLNFTVVDDRRDIAHFINADAKRQFGLAVGYSW